MTSLLLRSRCEHLVLDVLPYAMLVFCVLVS